MGTVQERKIGLCLQPQFDRLAADLISHSPSSRRFMIGLGVPVLAEYQTDKSDHDQDGSGDHQPMRLLHLGEYAHLGALLVFGRQPRPS
jgi:hypothetical protein